MKWQLEPHVSFAETGDGMVLLDERTGRYFQLNTTGVAVLRVLQSGGDPVSSLVQRYPGAAERIARDVEQVMEALIDRGLVWS
ncbi:hypothetical protein Lesp02_34680 [Lentzea sp. NBRC 105346]|uniref:lasso peptide biosynthesis PqqD family chaperone n=1 Tax=Lentzea sp. NBRC 105346 TaxID=3032205 RepID=UPI0024A58982|nr:lasso peptide biosynthesis PqqD family chaperone [Lentzea sp. NBRC 105346]GLZ31280.1 hypothetical protein Lesp02_34680 [Lentzea sp. NBRC 105346]